MKTCKYNNLWRNNIRAATGWIPCCSTHLFAKNTQISRKVYKSDGFTIPPKALECDDPVIAIYPCDPVARSSKPTGSA